MIKENPTCHIVAVDFSKRAIDLLKNNKDYNHHNITSFNIDITKVNLENIKTPLRLRSHNMDYCLFIFTLSSMSMDQMKNVFKIKLKLN